MSRRALFLDEFEDVDDAGLVRLARRGLWSSRLGLLRSPHLRDLRPLAAVPGLERLDIAQTGVVDIGPLSRCAALRALEVDARALTGTAMSALRLACLRTLVLHAWPVAGAHVRVRVPWRRASWPELREVQFVVAGARRAWCLGPRLVACETAAGALMLLDVPDFALVTVRATKNVNT